MIELYNGECLEIMKQIPDKSVDAIICDLPYGTTNSKWDIVIPFDKLWESYSRIIKDTGNIVLTSAEPFTSQLIMSNPKLYRYDIIWEKTISSGQLNVNRQPLRNHENILIFYKKFGTYNEQLTVGEPYKINRSANYQNETYNKQVATQLINEGTRRAKSVIKISNPRIKGGHPNQKPLELMEYLVKTYTNEGDIVLDNCMGVGTTGIACKNLNRNFIGIELNEYYFQIAQDFLKNPLDKSFNK